MRLWKISIIPTCVAFFGPSLFGQTSIHQAFPERIPIFNETGDKERPVSIGVHRTAAFPERRNILELDPISAQAVAAADHAAADEFAQVNPGPKRVGIVRSLNAGPLSLKSQFVKKEALPDGQNIWTFGIRSRGCFGMRLHFSDTDFGNGTALVYAREADRVVARGPFTGKGPQRTGQFWTETLPGDTAYVEVRSGDEAQLAIDQIVHFDKDVTGSTSGSLQRVSLLSAAPFACHIDAMCQSVPESARDAVGQINFVRNGKSFVCSGTLLTDLDDETVMPYFLTANHCISTQAEVDSMEVVYLWQSSSCGGSLPAMSSLPRSRGGTLLETSEDNDRTLIRLNGGVLGGVTLAGWTTAGLPDSVIGIHHPAGSFKRVTFMHEHTLDAIVLTCLGPRPPWEYHYCEVDDGMIEGGSSGSGLFNSRGQLMGQLYGQCCLGELGLECEDADCDNREKWRALYGEFEETFPAIRKWLEIGGTIHVSQNFSGEELGTPLQPFNTVSEANGFAWEGSRIRIQSGSYPETLTLSKKLTLLANGGPATIGR